MGHGEAREAARANPRVVPKRRLLLAYAAADLCSMFRPADEGDTQPAVLQDESEQQIPVNLKKQVLQHPQMYQLTPRKK